MRHKRIIFAAVLVLIAAITTGCLYEEAPPANTGTPIETPDIDTGNFTIAPTADINSLHLRDVGSLYSAEPEDVVTMYLTVREGNASDGTNHTWQEVNTYSAYYYDELGIDRYKVAALLQVGDENGPVEGLLGYGQTIPNATVQIRGQTSSRNAQKNYKIKLIDNSNSWNGQRTIALNKHMGEGLRFRNKLAYDLMTEIPQIMSLRTQFVHLYVRDLTGDNPDEFVDYGLYTQVEQLNKTALRAHGLDKNGYLYKVNACEFYEYNALRLVSDPAYDEASFSAILETKGRADHTKLLEMLHAVNDYTISNDELLERYFDSENIAYWMAFMILTGNVDTQNRNFYIYCPLNGDTWYIYPWDNDGMMTATEHELRGYHSSTQWESGISNYWGNILFRRALMSETFRQELHTAILDLLENYLSGDHIGELFRRYNAIVEPYVSRMPDLQFLPVTLRERETVLTDTKYEIWANYQRYLETLESPMPFYVGVPEQTETSLLVTWDDSFDFQNEDITYRVVLAKDYEDNEVLYEADGIVLPKLEIPLVLEPGQYFLRVVATNASGKQMSSFDYYVNTEGKVSGVYCFYVEEDGSIIPFQVIEGDSE